jgi:hypothetical protein
MCSQFLNQSSWLTPATPFVRFSSNVESGGESRFRNLAESMNSLLGSVAAPFASRRCNKVFCFILSQVELDQWRIQDNADVTDQNGTAFVFF